MTIPRSPRETERFLKRNGWEALDEGHPELLWLHAGYSKKWVPTSLALALTLIEGYRALERENEELRATIRALKKKNK